MIDGRRIDSESAMSFALVEVNERLCRMIPNAVWRSSHNQEFYNRVEFAQTSKLLQK